MSIHEVLTTKELADKLNKNQSYVLRTVKEQLQEGVDYRSAGARNYLISMAGYEKLNEYFKSLK